MNFRSIRVAFVPLLSILLSLTIAVQTISAAPNNNNNGRNNGINNNRFGNNQNTDPALLRQQQQLREQQAKLREEQAKAWAQKYKAASEDLQRRKQEEMGKSLKGFLGDHGKRFTQLAANNPWVGSTEESQGGKVATYNLAQHLARNGDGPGIQVQTGIESLKPMLPTGMKQNAETAFPLTQSFDHWRVANGIQGQYLRQVQVVAGKIENLTDEKFAIAKIESELKQLGIKSVTAATLKKTEEVFTAFVNQQDGRFVPPSLDAKDKDKQKDPEHKDAAPPRPNDSPKTVGKDLTKVVELATQFVNTELQLGQQLEKQVQAKFQAEKDELDKQFQASDPRKQGGGGGGQASGGQAGGGNPGEGQGENDQAKQDDKGGGGGGGGGGAGGGGGGGGGDGKGGGGDGLIGGGSMFAANGLNIPPSNTENSSVFVPTAGTGSSTIQSPDLGKTQKIDVGKFRKASGFSSPTGGNIGATDNLSSSDALTLQGTGKAPGGIAGNAALGDLLNQAAAGNLNGFAGGVNKTGSGGSSPLGEVPSADVSYMPEDSLKDPTKEIQFLASSGDGEDEGGDTVKVDKGGEEETTTKGNMSLELMPAIEDAMGKKSILGYLGYIRKICKDYRREFTSICLNPKAKRLPAIVVAAASPVQTAAKLFVAARDRGPASIPPSVLSKELAKPVGGK